MSALAHIETQPNMRIDFAEIMRAFTGDIFYYAFYIDVERLPDWFKNLY